jgi:uncharacterized circularly permuted ATP-grasp superfamily protein/uncharacterized alpha-E superfamily protein
MNETRPHLPDGIGDFLAGYAPIPGAPDELVDRDGGMRPVWSDLIGHLAARTPEQLDAQFARGASYLREAGVFYRQYGDADRSERDWPLSPVPVLIPGDEWAEIETGLKQRADLLERVLSDLYGENRLTREGHLPALLVAGNPEWLRPLVGMKPASGHFLHFVAFDIGRGADGGWWVLGDRTQAPSGSGYALENRMASMHSFAGFYRDARVLRVAGFFKAFRESLNRLRREDDSRVGILTPGPMNDAYFEHAYIARYLGMALLEGEDLTVIDGELMVRTISGPQPVSVLWRRLDANWVDPMELDETSRLGTPGLLAALRAGSVTMVNALGSGVLEARAFMAFLPRLSEVLTGKPLAIPNIATWWCGSEAEREHVLENASRMMIGPANSLHMPLEPDRQTSLGGELRPASAASLDDWLRTSGPTLVGQEAVSLSSTPVWSEGRLSPRPMSIRVFMARTPSGWQVMPGGYARIAASGADPSAVSLRRGGSVADVWVISDQPVTRETMLENGSGEFGRAQSGWLPSRAADNLFWLGRYVERAEGTMRLLRAYHGRVNEMPDGTTPLIPSLESYLEARGLTTTDGIPDALVSVLGAATGSANRLRDRFSIDAWASLADLQKTVERMGHSVAPGDDAAVAMGVLLRKITGFSGLVHDNMYRFAGWRFLSLGRALERAISTVHLLQIFADPIAPEGGFDLCIEIGDSVMTHRRRYSVNTSRATVIDLLALDPLNPRSVACQIEEILGHINLLPGAGSNGRLSPLARAALRLSTDISVHTPETLDAAALVVLAEQILALSSDLGDTYFN